MASAVVYQDVAESAGLEVGGLFEGKRFWVGQRTPQRTSLLDVIRANGGVIVPLEKLADWMIADHFRKDSPPGSISYEFVRKSVAKGEILDPNDFLAGPRIGSARDSGSLTRPAKSTRAAFTPEEDRILYKWASDAQRRGERVSGNEIYKQLEEKHPQHPWQSWRDRFVKKLQHLPPSRFDLSDITPPTPPLDHSVRVAEPPVVKKPVLVKNKDKARAALAEEQPTAVGVSVVNDQTGSKISPTNDKHLACTEYTVEQLAATFSTEDWESLYAFVEEIDSCSKEDDSYNKAWIAWAEDRDNQTAGQWQQYYEKVVRPQWLRDSISKRAQIKKKVEERLAASPTKSQNWSQTHDSAVVDSTDPSRPAAINTLLSDPELASKATAQQETPRYIRDGFDSAFKRIRGEVDDASETIETTRPAKILKGLSPSPTPAETEEAVDVDGTQEQPVEISSAVDSELESPGSQQPIGAQLQDEIAQIVDDKMETGDDEEVDSIASDDDVEVFTSLPRPTVTEEDDDLASIASSSDLVHIAPLPRPPRIPEDEDDEDEEEDNDGNYNEEDDDEEDDDEEASLPSNASNTPTPRATRYAAFNTQAILSPSQTYATIPYLPRPTHFSSPPHQPSDASTTESLRNFSSILHDDPSQTRNHQHHQNDHQTPLPPPNRPTSPTPSTTSTTSTSTSSSTDPDPPLSAPEINTFFSTHHHLGYSTPSITKALKRTRCRPNLAAEVLDAWRRGEPLPARRGVWSVQEDEDVRGGDGSVLARLGARHTVDGWGGVTERVRFLEAWEGR